MKKILVLFCLAALPLFAAAQYDYVKEKVEQTYTTTTKSIQEVDSRMCDVTSNVIFKPLVVTMDIIGERRDSTYNFKAADLVSFGGRLDGIREWATFRLAKGCGADVIVAATYNVTYNEGTGEGTVEIIGFPACFIDWKPLSNDDLEWVRTVKPQLQN